jgi:hypothetical protein
MPGSVTISVRSADFQRAFVAMRYFWGARGPSLGEPLEGLALTTAAADALRGLSHTERAERAKALSSQLARVAAALDQAGLWR